MRNIRTRRAFTLIELIIVIVILGILAGIAIVGYQAVINRAKDSQVEQAASSYGRQFKALAAFDSNFSAAGVEAIILESAADLPSGVNAFVASEVAPLTLESYTGSIVEGDIDDTPTNVLFTKDGSWACIELPTTNTGDFSVTSGRYTTAPADGMLQAALATTGVGGDCATLASM